MSERGRVVACVVAVGVLLTAGAAAAADAEVEPAVRATAKGDEGEHHGRPSFSLAIERVGGVSWTKVSQNDADNSSSLTTFQLGGPTINPYSSPRLGADLILENNLTVGLGASLGRYSASGTVTSTTTTTNPTTGASSTSTTSKSEDLGSLFIYTLTPRVGYRVAASPDFDVTPRVGLTLAGGSVTSGDGSSSYGVFAVALSGEVVGAYRVTHHLNLLAGLAADYTVAASASQSGSGGSSSSSGSDIKGGLFALQLWLGLGGYL